MAVLEVKEILKELDTPISNKYTNKSLYLNRELSWLEFNKSVLKLMEENK